VSGLTWRIVAERERAARDEWSKRYLELADACALVEAALVREREAAGERERAAAEKAWDEGVIAWCKNQNGSVIWDLNPYRGGDR
jgi:hypothetical protein